MTKIDISVSTITSSIDISDEERSEFEKILKSLNKKTNSILMESRGVSDRLLLFLIILLNINKKEKIIDNFDEKIIQLLKLASPNFKKNDNLDHQLIIAGIISEHEAQKVPENTTTISRETEEFNKIKNQLDTLIEEKNYIESDTINLLDGLTEVIEKISEAIKNL